VIETAKRKTLRNLGVKRPGGRRRAAAVPTLTYSRHSGLVIFAQRQEDEMGVIRPSDSSIVIDSVVTVIRIFQLSRLAAQRLGSGNVKTAMPLAVRPCPYEIRSYQRPTCRRRSDELQPTRGDGRRRWRRDWARNSPERSHRGL